MNNLARTSLIAGRKINLVLFDWKYSDDIEVQIFRIFCKKTNKVVGQIEIRVGKFNVLTNGNLGYRIEPEFRNQGYATEACFLMREHLLNTTEIESLLITADLSNKASVEVIRKIGGRQVGMFIDNTKEGGLFSWDLKTT